MGRTLAWERAGDCFFQTLECLTMRWDIQIAHYNVRAGPCGGMIAIWDREDTVVRRSANYSAQKKQLRLFGANGVQLGLINLDFGPLADVQIMQDETVIVATKGGLLRYYTEIGKNFVQLQIQYPIESLVLSNDVCYVKLLPSEDTETVTAGDPFQLASVIRHSPSELRHRILTLQTTETFTVKFWSPLLENPQIGQTAGIILVDSQSRVHLYDNKLSISSHRIIAEKVPLGLIALSVDNSSIAFSDGASRVATYPTDFHTVNFQTSTATSHQSICWIGTDALALIASEGEAEVLSLNTSISPGSTTTYFEDNDVALIPEIDGLRIIGTTNHSLLLPVAQPTLDIFKLGSLSPSAVLYSCVDQIDAGSPRPDQTVQTFGSDKLERAVNTCIAAALLEIEPKIQKRLLHAAIFGKSILQAYDSTPYLAALTKLRILNSLRSLKTSPFVITEKQINKLGAAGLMRRLVLRNLWTEAVSITELMHIPKEPIYIEWACWLIENSDESTDAELLTELDSKLRKLATYSRTKMALRALEKGRQNLAYILLENEPVANERVMLLLELNFAQAALEQAIISGDLFLVDYVLMVLDDQLPLPQLMRIIGGNQVAIERKIQLSQLSSESRGQLFEFLYHMDLRHRSLQLELGEISEEKDTLKQEKMLRALENKFKSINKKIPPESKACANWADLLTTQRQLENDFSIDLTGKSASDTILTLLKIPQLSQAQKIKTKLGIREEQFWLLRIRALVDKRDFDGLWEIAKVKKSSKGYMQCFNACFEAGNMEHAAKFLDMTTDVGAETKIRFYIKMKDMDKARKLAQKVKLHDPELLQLLGG